MPSALELEHSIAAIRRKASSHVEIRNHLMPFLEAGNQKAW